MWSGMRYALYLLCDLPLEDALCVMELMELARQDIKFTPHSCNLIGDSLNRVFSQELEDSLTSKVDHPQRLNFLGRFELSSKTPTSRTHALLLYIKHTHSIKRELEDQALEIEPYPIKITKT